MPSVSENGERQRARHGDIRLAEKEKERERQRGRSYAAAVAVAATAKESRRKTRWVKEGEERRAGDGERAKLFLSSRVGAAIFPSS